MPSGEMPVSNNSVVVVDPRRTVTSAENPCSARRPVVVRPLSNWGAATIPLVSGARTTPWPPVEQAVEDVVHERGDDDLVHRLQADRVDRRARGRPGRGCADLVRGGTAVAHGRTLAPPGAQRGPSSRARPSRRAMRSCIGGWVENSDARPPWPRNGLAIIRWLWVTNRSSGGSGRAAVPRSIVRRALASASGSWESWAPEASAWNSRLRLTAIWISPAAS